MRIAFDARELVFGIRWDKATVGDYVIYKLIICVPFVQFVFQWDNFEDL